jgi:DNA-binding NarL/FixJ family response regulator
MEVHSVMVVEDDSFTRSTLCTALTSLGIKIVAETGSIKDAISLAREHKPDACLIDLDLGKGPTGIDLAYALRKLKTDIGIVFLTTYDDPRFLRSNMSVLPGGAEYLVKKSVKDILVVVNTLQRSIESGQNNGRRNSNHNSLPRTQNLELTDLQVETLRLVSQGLTNTEIAKLRFITEKSVEQTLNRISKALSIPKGSTHNQRVHMARVFFRNSGAPPT